MLKESRFLLAAAVCTICVLHLTAAEKTAEITTTASAEKTAETTTTTTTVITRTVIREKVKWSPFRVCVLDFTTIDTRGQKRFLDDKNKPIVIPPQCTLNNDDRRSVDSVMQGFVRMIDAWDNSMTGRANRAAQIDDNQFSRAKALELYRTSVKGEMRPAVIGAEYLGAYLGRHNDVFSCLEPSLMTAAMQKLQKEPDFPKDFMLKLARETGATHLIYGTVADLRLKSTAFKGYGIETKTTDYQLDVIVKMVDLAAQQTVYSNVYTGSSRVQDPASASQIDTGIFQKLMKSALEQAAEELYDNCRPGRKNKISVTPLPYTLTVIPSGGMFFKPAGAEVFVDGVRAGNGGASFSVPAGKHTLEIKASGYKVKTLEVNVTKDETIQVKLEK